MFSQRIGDDKNWVNVHHYDGGKDFWLEACEVGYDSALVALTEEQMRAPRDAITAMLGDGE